jgi:vitamin K-dependent gamma-carboxylase-like protein
MATVRRLAGRGIDAWNRFWFERESTAPLALMRIAFGALMIVWTVSLIPTVDPMLSSGGIAPEQPAQVGLERSVWGLLGFTQSHAVLVGVVVLLGVSALLLTIGLATRVAAVVLWLLLLAIERRSPLVFNSGDGLLRILAFYFALAPSGAAYSVDAWLRDGRRLLPAPARAVWPLRLMQVQFSAIYLFAAWGKARGATWTDGTAVSYAMRITDVVRFQAPQWFTDSLLLSNLFTYGTLVLELSLAILVWNRKLRPWVLLGGISLHFGIDLTIRVGFFSLAMFTLYLVWVPAARAERVLAGAADTARRARSRLRRRPAAEVPASAMRP